MRVLCINSGSSSVKFALYDCRNEDELIFSGSYRDIGKSKSSMTMIRSDTEKKETENLTLENYGKSVSHLFSRIEQLPDLISHRIVQGGPEHFEPVKIDHRLLDDLKKWEMLAPDHVPPAIELIKECQRLWPDAEQIACFDTAFHHSRSGHRKIYALPREYAQKGVLRYGFHGLSYEYIVQKLKSLNPEISQGKLIICHLGHGASLAAVEKGRCQDTTMGFSPASGLVMSTRTGELDPEIPIYLQQTKGMKTEEVHHLIHKKSGLLGISEKSGDMEKLLNEAKEDEKSWEAVEIFCESVVKNIGAMVFLMKGLEALIFTGGIGENSPEIRKKICKSLQFYGLEIDLKANKKNKSFISTDNSQVRVHVIPTNEEDVLMRHALKIKEEKHKC